MRLLSTASDGRIVRANQTLVRWLGRERDEVVDRLRLQELLTVAGRIYLETHLAPLLRMQGAVQSVALDLVRPGAPMLAVLVNAVLQRDEAGDAVGVRWSLLDATDRRRYEQELVLARRKAERAARAKADLLGMMGHDLRTPLTSILTAVRILDRLGVPPDLERHVDVVRTAAETMAGLIASVLDWSRIDAGAMTLDQQPFEPRRLVASVRQSVEPKAEEKHLPFVVELDDRLPITLIGDPVRLGQVLTNLLGNAVKFTSTGSVTLALHVDEDDADAVTIAFTVRDTGIGIPPDRLDHVFDEYTQASADVGARFGGTGLGLAITKELLRLHGSTISVQSTLGEGSTFSFRVRFPRAPDAP